LIGSKLQEIAHKQGCSIVVTNHVVSKLCIHATDQDTILQPMLGDPWGRACSTRLALFFRGDTRWAKLVRSSWLPQANASFSITASGLNGSPTL
jgi:RAD51-like protein 2